MDGINDGQEPEPSHARIRAEQLAHAMLAEHGSHLESRRGRLAPGVGFQQFREHGGVTAGRSQRQHRGGFEECRDEAQGV